MEKTKRCAMVLKLYVFFCLKNKKNDLENSLTKIRYKILQSLFVIVKKSLTNRYNEN